MANYKIFDAFKTNAIGAWYFMPDDGKPFKEGRACNGFGAVKYPEGSVYTGDLYYDGVYFHKIGQGQQDFTRSTLGAVDPNINEKRYKFVGSYDYRRTDWIYGNGVLYYVDPEGKPTHFIKGFFNGLDKFGDYEGEFDYGSLLEGYAPENEFDYDARAAWFDGRIASVRAAMKRAGKVRALFIGDSYFELCAEREFAGENTFERVFPESFANAGLGGSRYSDWLEWFKLFGFAEPEKVVINLGFNDLHSGATVEETHANCVKFLDIVRENFPSAKIFAIAVVHAPNFTHLREAEDCYNERLAAEAEGLGITILDWNDRLEAAKVNCFHADGVHPNAAGYEIFTKFLNEKLG